MSIKTNSKLLLTVFLAGSLSGYVNASQEDDMIEEGSRLQITGAYNQLTAQIDGLEGSSFSSALASLYVNARQVALSQVIAAEGNSVLVDIYTAGTGGDGFATLNTNLAAISTAITTAMTTPNFTNITAIVTAINTAQLGMITAAGAPHSAAAANAGLQSLEVAVTSWLAFYPA